MIEVKEQCKKCFHFQVCANVLKQQLYIREIMLKEENPKCDNFVPASDVVEVVRCKDCQIAIESIMIDGYFDCANNNQTHSPDHFCSYGERKSDSG